MLNFKLKTEWRKTKIELEASTNNSSATSIKKFNMTAFLLRLATWISIIKYLILPLFL